jgi:hypothetical protein
LGPSLISEKPAPSCPAWPFYSHKAGDRQEAENLEANRDRDSVKKAIGQALIDICEQNQKFTDWAKYDNRGILTTFAILCVWSWDAMIRIYGISEQAKLSADPESWEPIWREIEQRKHTKLDLDELAKLYLGGIDRAAVLALGHLIIMIDAVQREIMRRVSSLRVGKQIIFWLDRFPEFRAEDFLKAIQPPRAIKLKSGKLIELSDPSHEIGRKRKKMDQEALSTLATLEFYEALKAATSSPPFGSVPFSSVARAYPDVSPVWEQAFPRLIEKQIEANLTEILPILSGKMEKSRFAVFNRYRKAFREELSFSALKGEAGEAGNKSKRRKSTLEPVSKIHHDELERETLDPDLERVIDVKKARKILSERLEALFNRRNAHKSTRPKIRKAIDLYIETGSLKEAATEIDEKTLRPFILELGLSSLRPVRTKRKF